MIDSKAPSPPFGVEFTGVTDPLDHAFVHRCAEDIVAARAFLVSEEAGYVTGRIIGANGGRDI